jgi:hypothetical protein
MFKACLAFAFVLTLAVAGFAQTNSEDVSRTPQVTQPPPVDPSTVRDSAQKMDSLKAERKKKKDQEKTEAKVDSALTGKKLPLDTAKAVAPEDTTKAGAAVMPGTVDTIPPPTPEKLEAEAKAPLRSPQDLRLFNDPKLIAKEYGFGIAGSLVTGALGFYIGSGIETAIKGESKASKGTLGFTGIRYDNFQGAFWGGATGLVLGTTLTTYFVGQTDEENGGLLLTLTGSIAATAGALYLADLMGVEDDIDWPPFIPLLALPSMGSTLGFNVSRWMNDRTREAVVGRESAVWLHPPRVAWGRTASGDRLEIHALNLTF